MILSGTRQYVFFGDSLTDDGNLFRASEGLVDDGFRIAETGWQGRISDGPTYAEYVAPLRGLATSLNYAVASSEAIDRQTLADYAVNAGQQDKLIVPLDDPRLQFDMNLGGQIERFAADTAGENLGKVIAFILIGGNDYGNIDTSDPITAVLGLLAKMRDIVASTIDAASDLDALGVDEVIVSSLPSARFLPSFAALPSGLLGAVGELVDTHNDLLRDGVAAQQLLGKTVSYLDITPFTDAIAGDPDQFGILAPWQLTLRDGDPATVGGYDASQIGFWDSIHPSAATHAVLGGLVAHAEQAVVLGARANDRSTGDGFDLVLANAGDDTIHAGGGRDRVFLGRGDDLALLEDGKDLGSGGRGDDTISGGARGDVLAGGRGKDLLLGDKGRDVLIDGRGDDTLRGGNHDDLFVFFEATFLGGGTAGANRMIGGNGDDRLILVLGEDAAADFAGAASQAAGLRALGLRTTGIETVDVVIGREGLASELGGEAWYAEADLWGFV